MNTNSIRALFAACAVGLGALGAGCEQPEKIDVATAFLTGDANGGWYPGGCPLGWYDADEVQILCVEGYLPVTKVFGANECVRCEPEDDPSECEGPWLPSEVLVKCPGGYEVIFNDAGTCKRCALLGSSGGCECDADCMRTGCSGQICSHEPVITTCEWNDAYACFDYASCSCIGGQCAWEQTPELLVCLLESTCDDP